MPIHETDLGRNRHLLNSFNHAIDLGLTDGIIGGGGITTFPALQTAISALVVHETQLGILRQVNKNIDVGIAATILSGDPPATGALLEAICTALDASLAAAERRTFACYG